MNESPKTPLQALTEAQERATKDLAEAESKVAALKAELKTLKGAIKILTPKENVGPNR